MNSVEPCAGCWRACPFEVFRGALPTRTPAETRRLPARPSDDRPWGDFGTVAAEQHAALSLDIAAGRGGGVTRRTILRALHARKLALWMHATDMCGHQGESRPTSPVELVEAAARLRLLPRSAVRSLATWLDADVAFDPDALSPPPAPARRRPLRPTPIAAQAAVVSAAPVAPTPRPVRARTPVPILVLRYAVACAVLAGALSLCHG